jgi:hypothetical protein
MKTTILPQIGHAGLFPLLGAVLAVVLWTASQLMGAGGHGIGIGFTLSFPYSEILHRINPVVSNWLFLLIGWSQWPMYGLVIGLVWGKGARTPVCLAILALHLVAVACCFLPQKFYESFW